MNARQVLVDAGGIDLPGGGRIRTGHALRVSGGLTRAEELAQLESAGIRQIADLRGEDEDRSVIENWAAEHGVAYAHFPVRGGNIDAYLDQLLAIESEAEAEQFQLDLYLGIIDRFPRSFAGAVAMLADEGPIGFGCAAGKDRTGIVTAFMHVLLGLSEEEAIAHYLSLAPSPETLRPLAESTFNLGADDPLPPGVAVMMAVRGSLLTEVFDHIRAGFGGLEAYLRDAGFPDDGAEQLAQDLLRRERSFAVGSAIVARDTEILNAAADLFRKRGFAAVGVDEIGRTAGVTGPAIYRHFKGKDDILGVLFDEGMDEITRVTSGTFDDPRQELRHIVYEHAAHVMNNPRLASIWLKEGRSLSEPHRRRYLRRAARYIERWLEVLERCFPGTPRVQLEVATHAAIGALNSVDDWPRELRTEEHIGWLADVVVTGLDTGLGRS